jgi:hypothetical protein
MVFKNVRGSRPATAATCLVGTREWVAKQDHPAHIPRLGPGAWFDRAGHEASPFGFR